MILIALGANLPSPAGAPPATLRAALHELADRGVLPGVVSPFYDSIAWPNPHDPPFVNAVVQVKTRREPADLLGLCKTIERLFGRTSSTTNAPRPLDLDLLDYDGRVEMGPPILPHPRLETRGFVLIPLRDIAPDWRHPVTGQSVSELIEVLPPEARTLTSLP